MTELKSSALPIDTEGEPPPPGRTPQPGTATVPTLFARVTAPVALFIGLIAILRGSSTSERWDRALFVGATLAAVIVGLRWARAARRRYVDGAVAIVSLGGLGVGIGAIERPDLAHTYWDGFGVSVLVVSVVVALAGRWLSGLRGRRILNRSLLVATSALAVADLASLVRMSGYTSDPVNNLYALNELLAAPAQRVPDANFIPQYDALYGYLLKPLVGALDAPAVAQVALALLSAFAVAAVLIGVAIAHRLLGRRSLGVALLLVVPFTCVTVLHGAALQGSIASSVQELPIRVFPGMLYFLAGSGTLLAVRGGARRGWRLGALGFAGGLVAWNSQDFGVAAVLAFGGVLFVGSVVARVEVARSAPWLLGLAVGVGAYPVAAALAGSPLSVHYVAFFDRTFGSGYGAAPIQVPGPVMLVLPVVLATAVIGWRSLLCPAANVACEQRGPVDYAAITAAFFGTWSSLGFIYYLNRSFASGQLQVLLLPAAVGVVAVLALAQHSRTGERTDDKGEALWSSRSLTRFPLLVVVSLLGASTLQSPGPVLTAEHLIDPPAGQGYLSPSLQGALTDVLITQAYATAAGGRVSYLGEGANYLSLALGVHSAMLFNDPYDVVASAATASLMCDYLVAHGTEWLVISERSYFYFADACGAYRPFAIPGTTPGLVERRT